MRLRINKVGLEADYFTELERPSKEVYRVQETTEHTHGILYFCPHCGAEFYGEWHCAEFVFDSCAIFNCPNTKHNREERPKEYKEYKKNSDLVVAIHNATNNFQKACQAEMNQVRELQNCPVCSGTLKRDYGFFMELGWSWHVDHFLNYIQDYWGYSYVGGNEKFKSELLKERADRWPDLLNYIGDENQILPLVSGYEHMRAERMPHYQKTAAELVEEKSELFDLPVFEQLPIEKLGTVKNNPDTLKNYVHNLIKLENNIYSAKKRLEQLYITRQDNEYAVRQAKYMPAGTQEILQEIADAEAVYSAQCAELERIKRIPPKEVTIRLPDYPVSPTLATPGLFNKKKVQAENEKLLAAYEAEMKAYQQEVAAREQEKRKVL